MHCTGIRRHGRQLLVVFECVVRDAVQHLALRLLRMAGAHRQAAVADVFARQLHARHRPSGVGQGDLRAQRGEPERRANGGRAQHLVRRRRWRQRRLSRARQRALLRRVRVGRAQRVCLHAQGAARHQHGALLVSQRQDRRRVSNPKLGRTLKVERGAGAVGRTWTR